MAQYISHINNFSHICWSWFLIDHTEYHFVNTWHNVSIFVTNDVIFTGLRHLNLVTKLARVTRDLSLVTLVSEVFLKDGSWWCVISLHHLSPSPKSSAEKCNFPVLLPTSFQIWNMWYWLLYLCVGNKVWCVFITCILCYWSGQYYWHDW
jgi:hypothetical protein